MANRKKPSAKKASSGGQAGRLIRIREAYLDSIDKQSKAEVTTPTELVNRLVREGLERLNLWPPRGR